MNLEFEEEITLIASYMKLGCVKSMQDGMEMQDNLDIATERLVEKRTSFQVAAAHVQNQMRAIQKKYLEMHDKVTIAERNYKTDAEHSDLEELLATLQAGIAKCDGYLSMVEAKSFKLGILLRSIQ